MITQDQKIDIIENMEKYGGSFVQCLAKLILHADGENLQKIELAWPNYLQQYTTKKGDK